MKNKNYDCQGQSLFEVVVAIAISAFIIVAIVSLAANSIRNATFSKNKALATSYAQEATEWLRGQRDNDINTFVAKTQIQSWCMSDLSWDPAQAHPCGVLDVIQGTIFVREVDFPPQDPLPNGQSIYEADVQVNWTDSQGFHEVTSSTNFTDWRQR